jgi:two-component system chemotaxis sensor kinase CheA
MTKRYLEIFCRQAEEHLASLQSGLLVLEKNPNPKMLLQGLLRTVHTLKGSARMVGLSDIGAITHTMEEQLKKMERESPALDAAALDLLLEGADAVALITAALSKGKAPKLDGERIADDNEGVKSGRSIPGKFREIPTDRLSETVRAKVRVLDATVELIGKIILNERCLEPMLSRLKQIARSADPATVPAVGGFRREFEEKML